MKLVFTENKEVISAMEKALTKLKTTTVEIGLPEGASSRSRWLLALHQRGSPIMRIPPRPVVAPALAQAEVQQAIAASLAAACQAAYEGDEAGIQQGFEQAGEAGVEGIRSYIDSGIKPGNSPVTISGGWIYNRVARKGIQVAGKGFDKPMYNTGELYNSFSYEVVSRT